MLAIQPISVKNNYNSPAFKQSWSKQDVEDEIDFIKGQVNEINEFIDDKIVPEPMKKPFKFFRVIANASIDGLAVFGSAIMLAGFIKKSYGRISTSNIVTKNIKPAVSEISKKVSSVFSNGLDKLVKTDAYKKFAKTSIGKKIIANTAFFTVKADELASKTAKKININGDKITKGTAGVLGVGAGATGAYEATIDQPLENYSEYEEAEVA